MIGSCGDCKWWDSSKLYIYAEAGWYDYAECTRIPSYELDNHGSARALAAIMAVGDSPSVLKTKASFGCNLFEAKDES